jgi:hypothetical protein
MYYLEMSTPVLVHPKTGEVVINVKNGPAPGIYKDGELDGPGGALTQFKDALGTRKNNAFKTLGKTLGKYIERDDKIRALEHEYAIAQANQKIYRKGTTAHTLRKGKSATIAKQLANLGAPAKLKHSSAATLFGYHNRSKETRKYKTNMNAAKRACGWRPQGLFRRLAPSKHSSGDCASEEAILDKIKLEKY